MTRAEALEALLRYENEKVSVTVLDDAADPGMGPVVAVLGGVLRIV